MAIRRDRHLAALRPVIGAPDPSDPPPESRQGLDRPPGRC